MNSNTYAVYGRAQEKELTELGTYNKPFSNNKTPENTCFTDLISSL
jgi:hypothetical protein